MFGNAPFNDLVAGVKYPPNVVRSVRNFCCAANEEVDTANVEGDLAIVASKFPGLAAIAPNVVAESRNRSTSVPDTGDTALVNEFSEFKNRTSPVEGADR
jgi:hypothetical protein